MEPHFREFLVGRRGVNLGRLSGWVEPASNLLRERPPLGRKCVGFVLQIIGQRSDNPALLIQLDEAETGLLSDCAFNWAGVRTNNVFIGKWLARNDGVSVSVSMECRIMVLHYS
ncbi:hypothetical protein DS843_30330 [Roseomonas genomospecies 6]|uniref:Uncharacterized protein n=1 Tax=Roseomonas genomospecies 6 TaxID=214106 RepID=A0A9W7KMZ7_9PROT|nr:hypothetical protein DS843_30330 [Roseomonas genomospecies 6]